jgi:hypothetical protein
MYCGQRLALPPFVELLPSSTSNLCGYTLFMSSRNEETMALVMLVSWELCNQRNVRVYKNMSTMSMFVLARIKLGARS